MSYDLSLRDPDTGEILRSEEKHDIRGGTYALGGTTELTLNVTYNYSDILYRVLGEKGIRVLYGMTGEQSIPILEKAISELKDDDEQDYWEPTEGNVRRALVGLLALARMGPKGVWEGD